MPFYSRFDMKTTPYTLSTSSTHDDGKELAGSISGHYIYLKL